MKTAVFETTLAPDGHLYCPAEFTGLDNARYEVTVTFDETDQEVSGRDAKVAATEHANLQQAIEEAERGIAQGRWVEHAEVESKLKRWAADEP